MIEKVKWIGGAVNVGAGFRIVPTFLSNSYCVSTLLNCSRQAQIRLCTRSTARVSQLAARWSPCWRTISRPMAR